MKKIKWGILGAGSIAAKLAEAIKQSPHAELYGVGSRSIEKSKEFANKFAIDKAFGTYEDLCACPDIEVIYIATPHSFHHEHSLLAMKHGKNVLCEKPFALDAGQSKEMIAYAKMQQVFLMEAMWSRLLPGMVKVKDLLAQEAIGKVQSMSGDFCFTSSPQAKPRLFEPSLGGGALLDVGIYPLTIACSLFGFPIKYSASANLTDKGVDATSHYFLEFADGAKAELMSSVVKDSEGEFIIKGDKGEIVIHPKSWKLKSITLDNQDGVKNFDTSYPGSDYLLQVEEVNKCLQQSLLESEVNSFEWTQKMMELMDSLREKMGVEYAVNI